jgi:hypothetical protein
MRETQLHAGEQSLNKDASAAEAREIERLERVSQDEERQRAAVRRDQALIEREQQASERDPQYRDSRPGATT